MNLLFINIAPSGGQSDSSPDTAPPLHIGDERACVVGYWYHLTVGEAIERIQREYREDRISIERMETMVESALREQDPWLTS